MSYVENSIVTVAAAPAPGYIFDRWQGPVTVIANTIVTVRMDSDKQVTAYFKPSDIHYSISASASQGGTVELSPAPAENGYPIHTPVTVAAVASPGYIFSHWQGDVVGSGAVASVIMDADKSVRAVFNVAVVTACDPPYGGTMFLDPPPGVGGYQSGIAVTITATPAEGYRFDHWSGDLSGDDSLATLTMDGPKAITAHFAQGTGGTSSEGLAWWWIVAGIGGLILLAFVGLFLLRALPRRDYYE